MKMLHKEQRFRMTIQGNRNNAVYYWLRRHDSTHDFRKLAYEFNRTNCYPPLYDKEIEAIAKSAMRYALLREGKGGETK
jgi:hypothetical protein